MKAKDWKDRVRALECVMCRYLDLKQTTHTNLHHIREGQGLSQRASDYLVVSLCEEHHQGKTGLHGLGTRGFYNRYRLDELDLLAMTIEAL
jgi:hypothetical protein